MILLICLCIIVLMLALSWIGFMRECKRINVPGPTPLPLIGNAHMFIVKPTQYLYLLADLSKIYGDVFRVHMLNKPYVVLCHPKYVEPLLTNSELLTKGKSYYFLYSWMGQGLLTATANRWKLHRKFLAPAFHFNILQNFLPVFCKNGNILRDKILKLADGKPVDLFPIVALTALDNVTESIMGVSVNAQVNSESEYVKANEKASQISALRMQVPILGNDAVFNLTSYKSQQDKALSILHGQSKKVIEERRQDLINLKGTNIIGRSEHGIKNKYAFLDLLLLAEIDGKTIDDESIREEVDTFMFGGHDTTTSGIVFSLYCISKHEYVQRQILEEQRNIFGDDMDRDPTYHELQQMKYLELVIKETLRLYPSVPLIERLMTTDTEVGELKLVEGTSVMINIFQIQRNPSVFEDPLEFRPERFDTSVVRNPYSWIAFSAGPRNCIGQRFAMMQMKVTLSMIIRQFRLLPVDMEPQLYTALVLRSRNGVHVKFMPRSC